MIKSLYKVLEPLLKPDIIAAAILIPAALTIPRRTRKLGAALLVAVSILLCLLLLGGTENIFDLLRR